MLSLGELGAAGTRNNAIQFLLCDDAESLRGMTATKAAETVLRESQPLTIIELVIALQRRGCRTYDNPRKVAKCLRSAFYYHRERFRQDAEKRWSILDQGTLSGGKGVGDE